MMDVEERKVKANMKPECVVSSSSVYDSVKSEETDDEDMCNNTNTSNSQSINIKEENDIVKIKEEDEVSTDDERSPEYVISSSVYNPVKSEETDDEREDTKTHQINNICPSM